MLLTVVAFFNSKAKGCVKKNLGWYYNKNKRLAKYINARGFAKRKSMHELHLKHENAMNIFYARCLLFQTRLCFNFNELNNTQKFKFMKWSKSRIYYLPCEREIYSQKTWRFYALEANKRKVQLNYSEKTCEVSLISWRHFANLGFIYFSLYLTVIFLNYFFLL